MNRVPCHFSIPGRVRIVAMLALALHVASLVPIRLPDVRVFAGAEEEVSHPCQGKQCGCRSRQQCLTQCCCTKRGSTSKTAGNTRSAGARPATVQPSVARNASSPRHAATTSDQAKASSTPARWIIVVEARRCAGEPSDGGIWNAFTALEPPAPLASNPDVGVSFLIPAMTPSLSTRHEAPPVPPPRSVA